MNSDPSTRPAPYRVGQVVPYHPSQPVNVTVSRGTVLRGTIVAVLPVSPDGVQRYTVDVGWRFNTDATALRPAPPVKRQSEETTQ